MALAIESRAGKALFPLLLLLPGQPGIFAGLFEMHPR
jgi:hypothetical protein